MGKILRHAVLAASLTLLSLTAQAAYRTGVQVALTTSAETATTGSITTQSGDFAALCISVGNFVTINTPTDNYSNTWTLQKSFSTTNGLYINVYTAPMTTVGSSETYTITWSGGNATAVVQVGIFTGRNTSSPLDGTPGTYQSSSYVQSQTGAAVTTSDAGSDIVECASDNGGTNTETFTAGSGFTIALASDGSSSTYSPAMVQYEANQSAGTYTPGWTTSNFIEGASVTFALKESSSSCTNEGYTSAGALATPNGSSGSYVGNSGAFVTPNCSSIEYWQPALGNFGVSSLLAPRLWLAQRPVRLAQLAGLPAANDDRFLLAAGGG